MSESNCLAVLQSYGDFLSNNPGGTTNESPMPHPLLFSKQNCTGSIFPRFQDQPGSEKINVGPFFGSLYIPPFWEVTFTGSINGVTRTRRFCATNNSVLETTTKSTFFGKINSTPNCFSESEPSLLDLTAPMFNKIHSVQFVSLQPFTGASDSGGEPYFQECWEFDMCNSNIVTSVGAREVTSYQEGSQECDLLMSGFCSKKNGYTCKANGVTPDNLVSNLFLKECSCLVDETDIEEKFCQPGNSIIECQEQNALQQFIPVTCFGQNCSAVGYKFGRIRDQQCNVTLCQQTIDVIGTQMSVNADLTMHCGTALNQVPPVSPIKPPEIQPSTTPESSVFLLAIVGVIIICVILPISVLLFKRSKKQEVQAMESRDILVDEIVQR